MLDYLQEKYPNFDNTKLIADKDKIVLDYKNSDPENSYKCDENDGLYLIIKIVLDEIYNIIP